MYIVYNIKSGLGKFVSLLYSYSHRQTSKLSLAPFNNIINYYYYVYEYTTCTHYAYI